MSDIESEIFAGIERMGLELPAGGVDQLVMFVELLAKWNRTYNLTAVRRTSEMVSRHIMDSLSIVPFVQGERVLDIGTGAGLPGLPVAIALPDVQVTLLDSSAKKLRFVNQALAELGVDNAEAANKRLEDYQPPQRFDTIVTRAFGSLKKIYDEANDRLLMSGGRLLAMKGTRPMAEMEELSKPDAVESVESLKVPGLDAERHLIILTGS